MNLGRAFEEHKGRPNGGQEQYDHEKFSYVAANPKKTKATHIAVTL